MYDDDDEVTPRPHDLGGGAERAWRHADAIEARLTVQLGKISDQVREIADELHPLVPEFERGQLRLARLEDQSRSFDRSLVVLRGEAGDNGHVGNLTKKVTEQDRRIDHLLGRAWTVLVALAGVIVTVIGAWIALQRALADVQSEQRHQGQQMDRDSTQINVYGQRLDRFLQIYERRNAPDPLP